MNINCLLKLLPVVLLTTTYTTVGMEGKKTIIENNKISDYAHVNNTVYNNNSHTIHIHNNNISNNASVINNITQPNTPMMFSVPMGYFPNMQPNYIWNTPYINQQSTIPVNYNYINLKYGAAQVDSQYQQSYKPDNIKKKEKKKKNYKKPNNKVNTGNNKVNDNITKKYTPLSLNTVYNYTQKQDTYYKQIIDKQFDDFNKKNNNNVLEEDIKEEPTIIESNDYIEDIDQQFAQIMGEKDILSKYKMKAYAKQIISTTPVKNKFLQILNELTKAKKIQNIIQAIENRKLINNKEFFNKMKEINLTKRIPDAIKYNHNKIIQEQKRNKCVINKILNNYLEQQFEKELSKLKSQHDNISSSDDILKFFDNLLKLKKQISETESKIKDNLLEKLNEFLINCNCISNKLNNLNYGFIYNIYEYLLKSYDNKTNIKNEFSILYYTTYHNSIIWRLKQCKTLQIRNTIKEIIDIIINNYSKNINKLYKTSIKKFDNFYNSFIKINNEYINLLNKENVTINDFQSIKEKYNKLYRSITITNTSFKDKDEILLNIEQLKNELRKNIKVLELCLKGQKDKKGEVKIPDVSEKSDNIIINNYKNDTKTISKRHNINNIDYNDLYLEQAQKYQSILDKFDLNNKDENYHISIINENFIEPIRKNIESNIEILKNLFHIQKLQHKSILLNEKNKRIIYNNTLDMCQRINYFFKYYTKLSDNNIANKNSRLMINKVYKVLCIYVNDFYYEMIKYYNNKTNSIENLLTLSTKLRDELTSANNEITNQTKNRVNLDSIEDFYKYENKMLGSIDGFTTTLQDIINKYINNYNLIEFYSNCGNIIRDLKLVYSTLLESCKNLIDNVGITKYLYYHVIPINLHELLLQINLFVSYDFTNIDVLKHTSNELLHNLNILKDRIKSIKEQDIININKKK